MRDRFRRIAIKTLKIGSGIVWDVVSLVLRAVGTVVLILVTTMMIFACIFVIYAKVNIATQTIDVDLSELTLNQTSSVYFEDPDSGDWSLLTNLESIEDRSWVSYEDIPENFEHAVVAIEDKRFYTHNGVDWFRTVRAFFNMFLSSSDTFGGSTITQQLIKNITTYDDVTVQRKFTEIFQALDLEQRYSKQQIIEWYLNVINFGGRHYGIASASDYYFGKSVSDLTLAEIASIAGITNNPSMYDPYIDAEANKERQENILSQMHLQGYISYDEYMAAKNQKLVFTSGTSEGDTPTGVYSYFVDALIEDVIHDLMELKGCSYDTAELLLTTGGYQIYATMDKTIQDIVDSVYGNLENIPETTGSDQQLQSAIVITDPYTGNIMALCGGVGEKEYSRGLNRATQSRRPPGSSIKPIAVYAPAMDLGLITPDTKFEDSKDVTLMGTSWMTTNYERTYSGVLTIRQGVTNSTNTVAAQVMDQLTPQASYNFLTTKLRVTSLVDYEETDDGRVLSDIDYAPLALGQLTYGITVREMAAAYDIFPNSGVFTESRTYSKILNSDGELVFENIPETIAAISDTTAFWMTDILEDVATFGTAASAHLSGMPTAGKTGTTSDEYDRWFVGFTPYYVAAVWTGYDYPEYISAYGNPALTLWYQVMSQVHAELSYLDFSVPENTWQSPVPGVTEVKYTIQGVSSTGEVLYSEDGKGVEKREIEATARTITGYTLVGNRTVKFKLQRSENDNKIIFTYNAIAPSPSPSPSVSPDPGDPDPTPTAANPSGWNFG